MKAARIYGVNDLRIEDISIPEPKADEVQVKVAYSGICGSDIHGYHKGWALPTLPHPLTGQTLPVVLGHEAAGEVVAVGANAAAFTIGGRVAIEPLLYCGECEACKKGYRNCCENSVGSDGSGNIIGFGANGTFAEYVNVKASDVYKMPASLDYQLGALVEPTAVAVQAVQKSGLEVGQTAAIFGAGPIGLLLAITSMAAGATDLFIVDLSEERLQRAREIGVKYCLNPAKDDVTKFILEKTGNGVDIVYDAAGVQATLDTGISVVKKLGVIQIVAVFNDPPRVPLSDILMKGVDLYTTLCYANVYPGALRLLETHAEQFRTVITKIIPLDELEKEGLQFLETDKSEGKVLVQTSVEAM